MNKRTAAILSLGLILAVFVYFWGLGGYGFIDPDEGRYAEIPREMIETGDFVTPRLNYVLYFEKPPLHYWLTAGAFLAFGESEFAGRFFPVLAGLGCCVLAYVLALKITKDKYAAALSGLILASSVLWFGTSRLNLTDMTLTFFFTASMVSYYFWNVSGRKSALLLFYALMALSVLTKGLIGVVLPGGIAFLHLLLYNPSAPLRSASPHGRRLSGETRSFAGGLASPKLGEVAAEGRRRGYLLAGGVTSREIGKKLLSLFSPSAIILFFVIVCPYFVEVCRRNPDYFDFFFIREHFLRYTTTIHARYEPFWFFIPIIIAGFIPWTGLLWDSMKGIFGKCKIIDRDSGIFLGLWFFVPLIFFSASGSKLITYILPCFPPLAILSGASLSTFEAKDFRRFFVITSVLLIPLAVTGFLLPILKDDPDYLAMSTPAMFLSITLLIFWAVSFFAKKSKEIPAVLGIIALSAMFAASGAFEVEGKLLSHKESTSLIPGDADDVVVYGNLMQGVGWYLKRRTIDADVLNELEFGAGHETESGWFISNDELRSLWRSGRKVVVFSRRKDDGLNEILLDPIRQWSTSADIVMSNF